MQQQYHNVTPHTHIHKLYRAMAPVHVAVPQLLCVAAPSDSEVEVAYPSAPLATIACNTLAVDEELQPNKIVRSLRVEGSSLLA